MGERKFKTARAGDNYVKHMIRSPEVTQVIRMKFRGEETTKLINLIVKGFKISAVFAGGFFGRPLFFLCTTLQEHTTSRRSINRSQNSAATHFFF